MSRWIISCQQQKKAENDAAKLNIAHDTLWQNANVTLKIHDAL